MMTRQEQFAPKQSHEYMGPIWFPTNFKKLLKSDGTNTSSDTKLRICHNIIVVITCTKFGCDQIITL